MLALVKVDLFLLPFLQATDEDEDQRLLACLISEHVEPIIKQILKQTLRSHFNHVGTSSQNQDIEDIRSEILIQLFKLLNELKANPQSKTINDFRSYVAVITYNVCYQYLRQKYPNRWRLKNKIRYLLTHHKDFAIWEIDRNKWLCGLAVWRGQNISSTYTRRLEKLYENPRNLVYAGLANKDINRINPVNSLNFVFNWLGQPLKLDDLINIMGNLWGDREQIIVPLDNGNNQSLEVLTDSRPGIDQIIDQRMSLQRLWTEVCELPLRQRVALLLNLRDEQGRGIITLIPFTRTATVRQVAEVLNVPLEEFAELWNRLPLEDIDIAKLLGATRQQVINLRKSARERLARRMKTIEKGNNNSSA